MLHERKRRVVELSIMSQTRSLFFTHTNTDMSYAVDDACIRLHLLSVTLLFKHFSDCSVELLLL